jgi:hypothetical protein
MLPAKNREVWLDTPSRKAYRPCTVKSRWEIEQLLFSNLEIARERYNLTRQVFNEVIRDIPSGLPHSDGALRVRVAGRQNNENLTAYSKAITEFSEYLTSGTVPERYRKADNSKA